MVFTSKRRMLYSANRYHTKSTYQHMCSTARNDRYDRAARRYHQRIYPLSGADGPYFLCLEEEDCALAQWLVLELDADPSLRPDHHLLPNLDVRHGCAIAVLCQRAGTDSEHGARAWLRFRECLIFLLVLEDGGQQDAGYRRAGRGLQIDHYVVFQRLELLAGLDRASVGLRRQHTWRRDARREATHGEARAVTRERDEKRESMTTSHQRRK
ncbi:hypothetical protein Ctob_011864, partial [Chrysochromulina tobinii]